MFKKQSTFLFHLFHLFHQSIRIPKTIQVVRLQAIQTIQTLYHPPVPVEREVFSVKSALGINIFWVKKGL